MWVEHRQIKRQLEAIHGKVAEQNPDSDKEERALYPAIDPVASPEDRETVFHNMKNIPEERYKVSCGQR